MPNHSIKKKKTAPSNITIDEKHSQILDNIHSVETTQIPQLEAERAELKSQLGEMTEDDDIDVRMEISGIAARILATNSRMSRWRPGRRIRFRMASSLCCSGISM